MNNQIFFRPFVGASYAAGGMFGKHIMVLKPESLRQKMIAILQDMTKCYETGECVNGE